MPTIIESRNRIAYRLSQESRRGNSEQDWDDAEAELVRTHAYFRSITAGHRFFDAGENWLSARKTIQWRERLESVLHDCFVETVSRPYLSLAATKDTSSLCSHLEAISHKQDQRGSVAFVAVLDGAPEAARSNAQHEGRHTDVLQRDSRFFEYCRGTLGLANGQMIERGELCFPDAILSEDRAFQDGCLGIISHESMKCTAIGAALSLRSHLLSSNYRSELAWPDELHARIVIASSWANAIRGLQCAFRDDIVIEDSIFVSLEECSKRFLLSGGIRLLSSKIDQPKRN